MQHKSGASALYIASQNGHIEVVRELLTRGAQIDMQSNTGASAFYVRAFYKSHGKSRNGRTTTVSGGSINRLLQTEVKRRKIQAKNEKNANFMALQRQMESSQQRQMRLQDISARKAICSQLETLEKRAIIYNFIL